MDHDYETYERVSVIVTLDDAVNGYVEAAEQVSTCFRLARERNIPKGVFP